MEVDWLILTAVQSIKGYFMPRREGIAFIVLLFLDFVKLFLKIIFWHGRIEYEQFLINSI